MKLEINYKENTEKHTNRWRQNNTLLNNEWVNNELVYGRSLETSEKENTATQNLWAQ